MKHLKAVSGIDYYLTIPEAIVEEHRGEALDLDKQITMDWDYVKSHIKEHGMRNSNTMAIAPPATIANIAGVYPKEIRAFKNIYMKENLSGNFVAINDYLVEHLTQLGLWNERMLKQLSYTMEVFKKL